MFLKYYIKMKNNNKTSYTLFIFRRDYRLIDNKGVLSIIKNSNVIPIFIFTPEQITSKNAYKSDNAIQFMIKSLKELDNDLKDVGSKLYLFYGDNIKVLKNISKNITVKKIVFNMDYTPYAKKRDVDIKVFSEKNNIECVMVEDYLLANVGTFNKKDMTPYKVYTPFRNNVMSIKNKIDKPNKSFSKIKKLFVLEKKIKKSFKNEITFEKIIKKIKLKENKNILVVGGRTHALSILSKIKKFNNYDNNRNILSYETTHLSAYIKFGCVSIREVFWTFMKLKNKLVDQLIWREFYYYIGHYWPDVLGGMIGKKNENFNKKYNKIKWKKNEKFITSWKNGKTGYSIVDACMKEINETGYMHNRGRLITANFLNRLLGTDWRIGEKYFATKLTDYDPIVNSGNWQWIASVGVDTKPYFQRLFNPCLQKQRFDKNGEYIKKWLGKNNKNNNNNVDNDIFSNTNKIVNYKKARQNSIKMYSKL